MMTITIPTESTPVTAVCRIRFERLRGSRKIPSVMVLKMIHTAASASSMV